ncbi:Gfo/Idh/MocA family protein [Pseudolysinimonas yzui]|uniref:Oxidoreductase n=1 Tax=Pseudolysinimonas yzui TaxID=2708254 RepID=A0A8J3GPZ0_9MICO|nr:Gfo/Idh/MocA family oxidoreductase [Pseudolysinimonas yzui]GHF13245.1 oxidoreductase [Pseudolysinimonas yzui]
MSRVGVGIVGAGVISEQYLRNLCAFPDVEVLFVADLDAGRAAGRATAFGIPTSGSVEQLLADDRVEIVVNLTVPVAHVDVGVAALEAGKHVWIEKPFAIDRAGAERLLATATASDRRLAGAPDTWLGPGLQAARRLIDEGAIGRPTAASAVFQSAGPEPWHPNPDFYYQPGGGPLLDMAPYYLTALVQLVGPISRVSALASSARSERVIGSGPRQGERVPVETPTHYVALLEFAAGLVAQAVFSFDGHGHGNSRELVVSGSVGHLELPDPNEFDGASTLRVPGREAVVHSLSPAGFSRGVGVLELARAVRGGVPERAGAALVGHVLDAVFAIAESAETRAVVEVTSTVERAAPLPVGWDPFVRTV